jgi:enterochelin esterase-like enzyme
VEIEMDRRRVLVALATIALAFGAEVAPAQRGGPQRGPRFVSPEVNADRTVTLRVLAPKADSVRLTGEILNGGRSPAFTRDSAGIWSGTVGPLPPNVYTYAFNIDGVNVPDPQNPYIKTVAATGYATQVEVPGDGPQYYDARPVPHGVVSILQYESAALGVPRTAWVYTPPGYNDTRDRYPVLYLLHGAGDTENGWVLTGRANQILDNLIADGRARPMVVVMPLGHPRQSVGLAALNTRPSDPMTSLGPDMRAAEFGDDLARDLMPRVEKSFRVSNRADDRAIMGLSMGGGQALRIGLSNLDTFHWVVGLSSALVGDSVAAPFGKVLSDSTRVNRSLKLLYLTIGRSDGLVTGNRAFDGALTKAGVKHIYREGEGAHTWLVWRRNLYDVAPLLFQPSSR